jgi:protein-S-isoprenylcysteine O-methyltransferase Ste14
MRRPAAAVVSVAWGVALGGAFGALLPYLLGDWHFHRPLPYWAIAQAAGGLLICAGLVPVMQSFIEFIRANGTPVPMASPPRLVVSGCYRYVRNPIYAGFMAILLGEVLVFGSRGVHPGKPSPRRQAIHRRAGRHTYSHRCSSRQESHPGITGSQ